ncbi:MAG: hypothetical protein HKO65_09040 [Gemmatimonadetes bacterium]|nr:hypothetical protein [Gemmatimonadota bacterium]
MSRLGDKLRSRGVRVRLAFWAGIVAAVAILVFLARHRPSWPWFSLGLLALLGALAVLSIPQVRRSLNLSWFGVTLLMLVGVSFFDLYLFHVETHRQRSERLEVRGVYFDPDHRPIRVGVGYPDLDVRLEGSPYQFDRWSLDLRKVGADEYVIDHLNQVSMVRLPGRVWWKPWSRSRKPALGATLGRGSSSIQSEVYGDPGLGIQLTPEGKRGTLVWSGFRAGLSSPDVFLDRRLSRRLSQGIPLSDLGWDSLPDRDRARELVLTLTRPGRAFGRVRISLPEYRLVERSNGESLGPDGPPLISEGDTVWVTSRGKVWAFSTDRVPGVSRVAAPIAVQFVRRPRPTGWALPSSEACGDETHRCAVVSTKALPPPQAHFDLGGFGLDTARYSLLARLETDRDGVRIIGADEEARFAYGAMQAIPALPASDDYPEAGVLVRVKRAAEGQQSAVLITVFGLFVLIVGALATVSGDAAIWERRKATSPNMSAAWAFVNVFLIFLGLRLALGLRVAYSPPFYDRAAATAVGLWITFALMLVALGRWSTWAPSFWRLIRWLERPVSKLFLPGVNGSGASKGRRGIDELEGETPDSEQLRDRRKARLRTALGLILMLGSIGLLLWQRPETAASLVVATAGIGAWLAMGLARRRVSSDARGERPLDTLTTEDRRENPALSLAFAAGGSVVLALAIHAPWMALVPVTILLGLLGANRVLGRWKAFSSPVRLGWGLFMLGLVILGTGIFAFFPWPGPGLGALSGMALVTVFLLRRPWGEEDRSLMERSHAGLVAVGHALFSGVGWVGVLSVLVILVFLSAQAIPPFVRFALVFILFLLAIRAGLACHRLLERGGRRTQVQALGVLVIPLGVLLVFMLFDFGLGLVFFVPMFLTVLLSARIDRLPKVLVGGSVAVAATIAVFAWSVLNPSVGGLRAAPDVPTFSEEFGSVGNAFTDLLRFAGMSGPVTRASIRSIAASDPELLEEALAFAGPSEALFAAAPSRDQVWGGRAYAASDLTGTGFAGTAILGRGVPAAVSYAENTYSVYVLSEHGALGGICVLMVYLALLVVVGAWIYRVHETVQDTRAGLAVLAMTVGGVLWLTLPAIYVAASNLALVPLTGQNMPFLGLNSWADVVLVSGLSTGIVFGLAALKEPGAPAKEAETGGREGR